YETLVYVFGLPAARITELCRAEISNLKLHRDPAFLLIVRQRARYESKIIIKLLGKLADILLLHPPMQHFLLKRNIDLLVRVARGLTLVVKRPHEGVGEENPREAFRI